MATQGTTLPNLTSDARLYKYVRLPDTRWKYLRADYDEHFLKPHSVFLPKSNRPVCIEGGYYVANDIGKWHRLHDDPAEAWRLFKLCRVQGQMRELELKARTLTTTKQNHFIYIQKMLRASGVRFRRRISRDWFRSYLRNGGFGTMH